MTETMHDPLALLRVERQRRPGSVRSSREVDVGALPPALDLREAAVLLGISRTAAYELVRSGNWPTPVLRLGHRIKIPTAPLLTLLGLSTPPSLDPDKDTQSRPG